ncbi:MAG: hypothetical protein MHM6MM_005877 [Cercozoa sp. M6MM]
MLELKTDADARLDEEDRRRLEMLRKKKSFKANENCIIRNLNTALQSRRMMQFLIGGRLHKMQKCLCLRTIDGDEQRFRGFWLARLPESQSAIQSELLPDEARPVEALPDETRPAEFEALLADEKRPDGLNSGTKVTGPS